MKSFVLVSYLAFVMSAGSAVAQIYGWPGTDPDPYFKKRDLELERERREYLDKELGYYSRQHQKHPKKYQR